MFHPISYQDLYVILMVAALFYGGGFIWTICNAKPSKTRIQENAQLFDKIKAEWGTEVAEAVLVRLNAEQTLTRAPRKRQLGR